MRHLPAVSDDRRWVSRRTFLATVGLSAIGLARTSGGLANPLAATQAPNGMGDASASSTAATFSVRGRHLFDPCGDRVILRGVNKMAVWDDDPTCEDIFPQIRMTKANVVRIVWLTDSSGEAGATVANLDAVISNCRANRMIALIELHDATGDWSGLGRLIDFWTRPDVLAALRVHEQYLLLNIGNEVGDENVTDADYRGGYAEAVGRLRAAGIPVPLVLDAAGWGHHFEYIAHNALALIDADPLHNLLFSLHVWWGYHGASAGSDFRKVVEEVVTSQIPFLVGEFSGVGGPCDSPSPFSEILDACHQGEIGWIAWEWGPGNEFGDSPCPAMNMTGEKDQDPRKNGRFENLRPGWPRQVVLDHVH